VQDSIATRAFDGLRFNLPLDLLDQATGFTSDQPIHY